MVFSKHHNLLFIHIPKNAGTSVSDALRVADKRTVISGGHTPFSLCPQRSTSESFAILRHPIDRFVSTYYFLRDRQNLTQQRAPHATVSDAFIHDTSLDAAVKLVYNARHTLDTPMKDRLILDDLWDRQAHFIQAPDAEVGHLFDFANLPSMWEWLAKNYYKVRPLKVNAARVARPHWSQLLNRQSVTLIEEIYAPDLELYSRLFPTNCCKQA